MKKSTFALILLLLYQLVGCASSGKLNHAIDIHRENMSKINQGMPESEFLELLGDAATNSAKEPIQRPMRNSKGNANIYFVAVREVSDGNITDDEFVPYVFYNGALIASGWKSVGGVKSVGDPRNKEIGKWRSIKGGVTRDEIELILLQCELDASSAVTQTQARDKAARKSNQKQVCTNNGWGQQTCVQEDSDPWGTNELGATIGSMGKYARIRDRTIKACMAKNKYLPNES